MGREERERKWRNIGLLFLLHLHYFLLNALLLNIKHIVVGIWKCHSRSLIPSLLYNTKEKILKNDTKKSWKWPGDECQASKKEQRNLYKRYSYDSIWKSLCSVSGMRQKYRLGGKKATRYLLLFSIVERKSYTFGMTCIFTEHKSMNCNYFFKDKSVLLVFYYQNTKGTKNPSPCTLQVNRKQPLNLKLMYFPLGAKQFCYKRSKSFSPPVEWREHISMAWQ